MARGTTISRLAPIAADQWGLFTRSQAERASIPRATFDRLVANEDLVERVAHGVYRLRVAPIPDHLELRAAWLQLAPDTPAWERRPHQGVVSHRSAVALYEIGDLAADRHEFTHPVRRQSRRPDVRLHRGALGDSEWIWLRGLPVTRPSRIADDLLRDDESPEAVAQITADAIGAGHENAATFLMVLGRHAARFGLPRDDGRGLLLWLLDLAGNHQTPRWLDEAEKRPPTR